MQEASARHDELVRDAIEAHGGYVVKTTGDGFHAAFASAARRSRRCGRGAARAGRGAVATPPGPLRVRMGIHSGHADLRDGDYYGTAVNKAARLMSAAHGGQIVVSLATEELVHDGAGRAGRPGRARVARPGATRAGVPGRAPGPRSASSLASRRWTRSRGTCPCRSRRSSGATTTSPAIVALLDDSSLVTLTGTGRRGQDAPRGPGRGRGGAALRRRGVVLRAGVRSTTGRRWPRSSRQRSAACSGRACRLPRASSSTSSVRELLLVLDNCEHLLDEASDFADAVVRSCPNVRVVATSREALDVAGERVVRVRSLDAPRIVGERRRAGAERGGAPVHRSRRGRRRGHRLGRAQLAAVGEICRRVDGIPLAIELAAARTASMSPADVAAHLDERFRLLTGKRRGRVERHQTLRATVEWSYQLLDDDERLVFDRLGVFAGTFDAAGRGRGRRRRRPRRVGDRPRRSSSLVAKSMLVPETGADGTTRYGMLETLRQFARERLDESGDTDRWRRAAAEHYATAARDIGQGTVGPDHVLLGRASAMPTSTTSAPPSAGRSNATTPTSKSSRCASSLRSRKPHRGHPDMGLGALAAKPSALPRRLHPSCARRC